MNRFVLLAIGKYPYLNAVAKGLQRRHACQLPGAQKAEPEVCFERIGLIIQWEYVLLDFLIPVNDRVNNKKWKIILLNFDGSRRIGRLHINIAVLS